MKIMKMFVTMAFVVVAANSSMAYSGEAKFHDVFTQCLSHQRGTLVECGRIASLEAGRSNFEVAKNLSLNVETGEVVQAEIAYSCEEKMNRHWPFYSCDVYECEENHSLLVSICKLVGQECSIKKGGHWHSANCT